MSVIEILIISFYIVFYIILLYYFVSRQRGEPRYKKSEEMFFNDLDKQLNEELVKKVGDVVRIQQAVADAMEFPPFASEDLAPLLRVYQRKVIYSKEENKNKKFKLVDSLLNRLLKEKPYEILPDKERGIALNLQKSIKGKNVSTALNQLGELTNSLGEKLKASSEVSKRTMILTIVGTVVATLGLVFTVLTFFF